MMDVCGTGPVPHGVTPAVRRAALTLAVVAAAAAAMLWHATGAHAATSQTYTVASSSPAVLVSGLRAGDKVDIVATLNTTDVNENGEGEPLKLQSSGGFAATIS